MKTDKRDLTLRRKLRRGLALLMAVVLVAGLGLSLFFRQDPQGRGGHGRNACRGTDGAQGGFGSEGS